MLNKDLKMIRLQVDHVFLLIVSIMTTYTVTAVGDTLDNKHSAMGDTPASKHNALGVGTTPNIQEIFIGRCLEYVHVINPEAFARSKPDCARLWELFHTSFAYKKPCDVTIDDYTSYAQEAAHKLPADKTLFWSNVYPLVNEFSRAGRRFITISESLMGFVVDKLRWCGQLEHPGINYHSCPTRHECTSLHGEIPDYTYWQVTSQYFSIETNGVAHILLNGTHPLPYDGNSIFATSELIYLTGDRDVTHLHIMVLHDIDRPKIESCGEGSILQLQTQALSHGLQVHCEDDPVALKLYQCIDALDSPDCACLRSRYSRSYYDKLTDYFWIKL